MSLQIWLPFTKDDSNYGVLDMNPTSNTGKKVNSDHGGGYEFNNAERQYISYGHNAEINNFKSFSISCWAKSNVVETRPILALTYDMVIYNSGFTALFENESDAIYEHEIATKDKFWHNYTLTFDYNLKKFCYYIDGNIIKEHLINNNKEYKILNSNGLYVGYNPNNDLDSNFFNGIITDVRVYDHCISHLEIKQLSVGLIGHYPLNDEYITSTKNLCEPTFSAKSESAWGWCTYSSEIVDIVDSKVPSNKGNKIVATFNGSTEWGGWNVNNTSVYVSPGEKYVYSLYVKTDKSNELSQNMLYVLQRDYNTNILTEYGCNFNSQDVGGGWKRLWGVVEIIQNCRYVDLYVFDYPSSGVITYYICAPQFEKSSELTPYTPSVREGSKYCYDISGKTNNIPLSEDINPLFVSDTARYSGSYNFNEVGQTIGTREHIKPTKNVSISAWVKSSKIDTVTEPNVDVDGINIYVNNSGIIHLVGTFGDLNSGVSCINIWTHVCGTYDGITVKLYVNGVLKTSKTYSSDLKYIKGAAISSDSKSGITCKVSDFRIFSTALKDDYITDLYNMGAAVSSGTLAAYELNE